MTTLKYRQHLNIPTSSSDEYELRAGRRLLELDVTPVSEYGALCVLGSHMTAEDRLGSITSIREIHILLKGKLEHNYNREDNSKDTKAKTSR